MNETQKGVVYYATVATFCFWLVVASVYGVVSINWPDLSGPSDEQKVAEQVKSFKSLCPSGRALNALSDQTVQGVEVRVTCIRVP